MFIYFISEMRCHKSISKEIKDSYLEVFPLLHLTIQETRCYRIKTGSMEVLVFTPTRTGRQRGISSPVLPLIPALSAVISGWVQPNYSGLSCSYDGLLGDLKI